MLFLYDYTDPNVLRWNLWFSFEVAELIIVLFCFSHIAWAIFEGAAVRNVEGVDTCLMCGHADQNIFLLFLSLRIGIEECVKDPLKCLHLVNWPLLLLFNVLLILCPERLRSHPKHLLSDSMRFPTPPGF